MTSEINPNSIDTTYPVAGQDNSTQGFRNNWTNIRANFAYAEQEITDLQNNVLLKSPLSGTSVDNNLNGSLVYDALLQDLSFTRVQVTPSGIPLTATLNYSSGHYQTFATTASTVIAFGASWPISGIYGFLRLEVDVTDTAHTITLPVEVNINTAGIVGLDAATNEITFPSTGKYTFDFGTYQVGATISVTQSNSALTPFNNTNEDLADGDAADLGVTTSYFSTAAAETATLAAGIEGQIKVFAMRADSGDMVITVTNAGWKSSGTGTITFNDIGDACTLQYTTGKWFCIGNNGCSFA